LTQFYNVKWVEKNSLILYLGQKWAPIEINGKNCKEHPKISQNKTPGDTTSSLGFSSKNWNDILM